MGTPHIKNINTISLKFIEGDRNYPEAIQVLKHEMGLSKDDLVGMGFAGKDSVHVRLANNGTYNQVLKYHYSNKYDTTKGSRIEVLDVSTYKTKVFMKNVPFTLPNSVLRNILENHGDVESINTCYFSEAADEFLSGLQTMERVATMKSIHTAIPSTYYLNLTQSYIYFSYLNQPKTCTKCGSKDHLGKCPIFQNIVPWKRGNVLNLNLPEEDFPPLQKDSTKIVPEATPAINDDTPETTLEKNLPNAKNVTADPCDLEQKQTPEKTPPDAQKDISDTQPTLDISNQTKKHTDHLPTPEEILSNGPIMEENSFNAGKEKTKLEHIPEKNLSISLSPKNNPYNAENIKTNQECILEKNLSNHLTQEKSQKHAQNMSKDQEPIPEKNLSIDLTQGKGQINAISVATEHEPKLEENLINVQKPEFSPPNLRLTTARKAHTYV